MSLRDPVELIRVQRRSGAFCDVAVAEMQGLREKHEDAHFTRHSKTSTWEHFGVLDGHGGSRSARLAAKHLPAALETCFSTQPQGGDALSNRIRDVFVSTDRWLFKETSEGRHSSGSTCVTGSVRKREDGKFECFLANAGDSCGILLRCSQKAATETVRHRPDQEIEAARIIAAGGSVTRVGLCHRLDGILAVSRGFADFKFKDMDAPPEGQKISCIPDVYSSILDEGDFMILGCDGVFDFMSPKTLVQKLLQEVDANERLDLGMFCIGVLERCLELQRLGKSGQGDNMTLMVVKLGASDGTVCQVTNEIHGLQKLEQVANRRLKNLYFTFLEYCGEYGPLQPELAQKAYLMAVEEIRKDKCLKYLNHGMGELCRLPPLDKVEAVSLLKTILRDLLANPEFTSKVRRVKLSTARMQRVTSASPGVESILSALGYVRENEELVLPSSISPGQLRAGAQSICQRLDSEIPTEAIVQAGCPMSTCDLHLANESGISGVGMCNIIDGVYLGTRNAAKQIFAASGGHEGITHILSVSQQAAPESPFIPIKMLTLPMSDHGQTQIFEPYFSPKDAEPRSLFSRAYDFIDGALEKNRRVLVHCERGQNRSATIVIGFLMKKRSISYSEAHSIVSSARPMICIHGYYVTMLQDFETFSCRDVSALVGSLKHVQGGKESLRTIKRILQNVVEHPEDSKFRRLALANARPRRELAEKMAAMNLLEAVGWVKSDGWHLTLPLEVSSQSISNSLASILATESEPHFTGTNASSLDVSVDSCSKLAKELMATIGGDDSIHTLQKLIRNVLEHPDEPKFRQFSMMKDRMRKDIAEKSSAVDLLRAAGWRWTEDSSLTLPFDASLQQAGCVLECLDRAFK